MLWITPVVRKGTCSGLWLSCVTGVSLGQDWVTSPCCSAREMLSGAALGIRHQARHRGMSAVSDLKARNHLCRQLKQVAVRKHAHLSLQCSKTKPLLSHTSVGCRQQPAAEFVPHTLATPRLEMTRPRWWWWDFCPCPRLCMCTYLKVRTSQTIKKTGCCKGWRQAFLPLLTPILPDGTNSADRLFFSPSCPPPQLKNDLSAWCRYRAVVGSKIYKKTCTLLTLPFLMGQPIFLLSLLSCGCFLWDILDFGLKNLKAPFVCHLTTETFYFSLHSTQQTTTRLPEECQNISVTKYL